jgi:RNA polymerase sigma factor (TIGR02999 family)
MTNVTEILNAVHRGEREAAAELLPLVYAELRQLAARQVAKELPGQTLNATALVHEAYLRLVGESDRDRWDNRGHFFGAATEAMRRILVEAARRRLSQKRGGGMHRQEMNGLDIPLHKPAEEVIAVSEALDELAMVKAEAAELVKLRYFGGFEMREIAAMLHISSRTADNLWAYARAWLAVRLADHQSQPS